MQSILPFEHLCNLSWLCNDSPLRPIRTRLVIVPITINLSPNMEAGAEHLRWSCCFQLRCCTDQEAKSYFLSCAHQFDFIGDWPSNIHAHATICGATVAGLTGRNVERPGFNLYYKPENLIAKVAHDWSRIGNDVFKLKSEVQLE